jgi:hypothetical protein
VVTLIGRGLTNKEIAYELEITERGVAAQVSRMLDRYGVPNRAGLTARVLAELVAETALPGAERSEPNPAALLASLERELEAYRAGPFLISVTIGPEHRVMYRNDLAARVHAAFGSGVIGRTMGDRADEPRMAEWLVRADECFRTGQVVAGPGWTTRDGKDRAPVTYVIEAVLQPSRDSTGAVQGILWIMVLKPRSERATS